MTPGRLLAVTLTILVALPASALASDSPIGTSAWPYKKGTDSGLLPSLFNQGDTDDFSGWTVTGWDACVTWPTTEENSVQQYEVPNCTRVSTPWIPVGVWGTKGWALYCPGSAPVNWNALTLVAFQAAFESKYMTLSSGPNQEIGPSPAGSADYYSTNGGVKAHSWAYLIACGNDFDGDFTRLIRYCCGAGPSASIFTSRAGALPGGPRGAGAERRPARAAPALRGPALRRVRRGRVEHLVRELDLVPRAQAGHTLRCRRGWRRVSAHHAVGWYTPYPPKRSSLDRVRDTRRLIRGGVAVDVHTGGIARRTARLQVQLTCER